MTVRTRYAPSPTGDPHLGGMRTALFEWLLARHEGGRFILRIEDTDRARYVEGAVEAQIEALRWLGLDWDEGPDVGGPFAPYVQSQRLELYHRYADQLMASGHAYRCYCSPERLEQVRAEQTRRKEPPRYDRRCRDLSDVQRAKEEAAGVKPVVRFKTPLSGEITVEDYLRGDVAFDLSTLDDFVMLKSDGFPTYHLAQVVDDHLMEISHVLRGEEWLPSAPRHLLIYRALGWEPPVFVHLPVILGKDRAKLSKRHGAASVLEYRDHGYLPEAVFNFLGLLGWSLDDRTEVISREQFVRHFSLERVVKNPAIFNPEKLDWMNGVYIRSLPDDRLAQLIRERLEAELPDSVRRPLDAQYVRSIVPLVRERVKRLDEVRGLTEFFFTGDDLEYPMADLLGKALASRPEAAALALHAARERAASLSRWDHEALEGAIRPLAEDLGLKTADLFMLLRVAVTGRTVTPPLFESMTVLGREHCLARLDVALVRLGAAAR